MKKILAIIVLSFLLSGNSYAKYIEIVCTPDEKWESDLKRSKIWFAFTKPKYFFHFDEKNLKIIKIGITKDPKDLKVVNYSVEKKIKYNYPMFGFHTSTNLSAYEDVVNVFELVDFDEPNTFSYFRFGLRVEQYRLKPAQTKLIAKEMRDLSLSEFLRAKDKVSSETFSSLGTISSFGGLAGTCENSSVRNW